MCSSAAGRSPGAKGRRVAAKRIGRRTLLAIATPALGALLAACGSASPTATTAPAKPAAPAPTTAPAAAAPTAPAAAPKGTTVKLLETPSATVQAMNDDFTKKTGIKIDAEIIPQNEDSTAKLVASFNAGGTAYDAVRVDVID